jgi:hypothetical protein
MCFFFQFEYDCPGFYKTFICKQIVGVFARLKHLEIPIFAKQRYLAKRKKSGRPSKVTEALIRD